MKHEFNLKYGPSLALFIIASMAMLILIQMLFLRVMEGEALILARNINYFFMDHKSIVNPYHIAQALSDYESFNMLRCSKLLKNQSGSSDVNFLDLSFKNGCHPSVFWLSGIEFKNTYTAGNGDLWRFEGIVVASDSLRALFWSLRGISQIFIVALIFAYRLRVVSIQREAYFQSTKDRQRAQIMQNLAHDIKNPLAVFELIAASKNWEDFLTWKTEMVRAVESVHAIIADFKKDTDTFTVNIREDKLNISDIASVANKTLGTDNVSISSDSSTDGVLLRIDRIAIERALLNLIANAVEAGARSIEIRSKIDLKDLIITVIDNGPGVPIQIVNHLFVRGQSFGKAGGQGIGLFNVRTIADGHGGAVKYRRTDNRSVFELYLPSCVLETPTHQQEILNKTKSSEDSLKKSVLVCIKDEDRKRTILRILSNFPVKIQLVVDGLGSPSIVFTDDANLAESYLAPGVQIVMDTGKEDPEDIARQLVRRIRMISGSDHVGTGER
jgi:signal transduction histidine kinase